MLEICESDFFFFQAEDGIRDVAVTGVQTCALPISRCRDLECAIGSRGERDPFGVRVGGRAETTSEERPQSQVSVAETERIGGEAEEIRRGLIVKRVPRIQRQPFVGRAEAGEQTVEYRDVAVVG